MTKWKTIAIIFIILFILETALIVWAVTTAIQDEEDEKHCIINVCANYPSYAYDPYTHICGCYDYSGELQKEVYVTGLE